MSVEKAAGEFRTLFKQHLKGVEKAQIRIVTCTEVDWENKTMSATDENDLPYEDISCGLGAIAIKPALGSDCVIAILEGEESIALLLNADEADEIVLREGEHGGLTITPKLVEQLNKTNELLSAILQVLNGSPIPEPGNGAPSALQIALQTAVRGKELGDYSEVEDKTILH